MEKTLNVYVTRSVHPLICTTSVLNSAELGVLRLNLIGSENRIVLVPDRKRTAESRTPHASKCQINIKVLF